MFIKIQFLKYYSEVYYLSFSDQITGKLSLSDQIMDLKTGLFDQLKTADSMDVFLVRLQPSFLRD